MRKRIVKMLLSMMLTMVCVLSIGITVYADAEYESGMTEEEVIEKYTVSTGNEQADNLFNEYLEVASTMFTDERYAEIFESFERMDRTMEDAHIKHTERTHEDWVKMTTFEKILWDYLYVAPKRALSKLNNDVYFGSLEAYQRKVYETKYEVFEAYDVTLAEAYKKLMDWQYYYMIENYAVYNFITGMDTAGRTEIAEVTQFVMEESKDVSESSEVNVEVVESSEEIVEATEPQVTDEPILEEEKGIWDDVIQSLKEKWLTFLILGILVIALVGVTIYRKSKAIDDDRVA